MSDHKADFSANGSGASGRAVGAEGQTGAGEADETAFLAELARAMQSTAAAEQARNAEGTEQRRQVHIDAIRAREALEAEELRELAKEDVKGIDAWSDGEIKRIKLERERRIAARRDQLQIRLEEHRNVVSREVEAVEAAIAAYKAEIDHYFRRLEAETDPVAIAQHAGTRPPFPVLDLIGPDQAPASSEFRHVGAAPAATQAPVVEAAAPEVPTAPVSEVEAPSAVSEAVAEPPAETPVEAPVEAPAEAQAEPAQAEAAQTESDAAFVAVVAVAPDAEAEAAGETPAEATPEPVAASAPDENAQGSQQPDQAGEAAETPVEQDAVQEPVGALAEARVVMPKSTGAGSWLRWPNSSSDQSDNNR